MITPSHRNGRVMSQEKEKKRIIKNIDGDSGNKIHLRIWERIVSSSQAPPKLENDLPARWYFLLSQSIFFIAL